MNDRLAAGRLTAARLSKDPLSSAGMAGAELGRVEAPNKPRLAPMGRINHQATQTGGPSRSASKLIITAPVFVSRRSWRNQAQRTGDGRLLITYAW